MDNYKATYPLDPVSAGLAGGLPAGLIAAFRARTHALHVRAERSGIMRDVLRGTASRYGYALLLRTLLPAYRALEAGLHRHADSPLLADVARPELYRSAAIESDLYRLAGPDWTATLPDLSAGEAYAGRVAAAAEGDGSLLIAHAYTRFLGDLSGGRIMAARLAARMGLTPDSLNFYEFPRIADLTAFKAAYLGALDGVGRRLPNPEAVIEEAGEAFLHNILVSEATAAFAQVPVPP